MLPEVLVHNVYFRRKERAAPEPGEVLQSRIVDEESTELLPGGVRLDVGEIKGCKLVMTETCSVREAPI